MKDQIAGRTASHISRIASFLAIARCDNGVLARRQLNVHQRASLTQGEHGLPLGFLNGHVYIGDVFILRPDRKRHVQVVTRGLLDSLRLILADATGKIGNPVLLLPLNLHA